MRIALTSDLHVEHHPDVVGLVVERTRALGAEVLIVAGDVSHDLDRLEAALGALGRAASRVLFVPGNHDLWCLPGTPSSRARFEEEIPRRCARAGVDALGDGPVEIGGVVFCGVTGWYDYSLRTRELDGTFSREDYARGSWGRLRWNDKARVVWPGDDGAPLDDPAICDGQVARLERQLDEAGAHPTVVVTHHLPFAALTTSWSAVVGAAAARQVYAPAAADGPESARARLGGELPWSFINGFMGSERLGQAMQRARNVVFGCCGHTHFRKRESFAGAAGRFVVETSPVGYPREYARYGGLTLAERVTDRVTAIDLG
jgi:3',5'-cyclic AMP phosphodiesterase CpdA